MKRYGIVAIGYNRPDSMQRLLTALEASDYSNQQVTLFVSIDNCGDDAVENVARAALWSHGEKVVRTFPQRQGLRNHILQCGTFLEEYDLDAIAVFEDDVVPSPVFFSYMTQCAEHYSDHDEIAGISLYKHGTNVSAKLPFIPQPSRYDVFFMQFAQSWGQVWMRRQWKAFSDWYISDANDHVFDPEKMPPYVCKWPESSWLKYHIKYCMERGKYFVYPYVSYTTCFSEAGEHTGSTTSLLQVPMQMQKVDTLRLPDSISDAVAYDGYFEYMEDSDICFDLYGLKGNYEGKGKLLSTKKLPYQVLNSYALILKPQEMNYLNGLSGSDVYLYDLSTKAEVAQADPEQGLQMVYYYYNYFPDIKYACSVLYGLLYRKAVQILRKVKKKYILHK